MSFGFSLPLTLLALLVVQDPPPQEKELTKADRTKTCGEFLTSYRSIRWHYDYATASELARETGRPLFVIFCRAGSLTDPVTKKPRAAS